MSTDDDIFLATSKSLGDVAWWLSETLDLERIDDPELEEDEYFFRGRARTVDGKVLFVVGPNIHAQVDPEPEDVSAIDRYTGVVAVRLVGMKDEESQGREACAVFNELAAGRPDVALVLSHALSLIVAAYLPGVGVHSFPAGTTLDVPDDVVWGPSVVG